jgi:hypothetical protein
MTDIKNYDVDADFSHHKDEFGRGYEIIRRYCDLSNHLVLDLGSGPGSIPGFWLIAAAGTSLASICWTTRPYGVATSKES